jgi:hypothetical protein
MLSHHTDRVEGAVIHNKEPPQYLSLDTDLIDAHSVFGMNNGRSAMSLKENNQ